MSQPIDARLDLLKNWLNELTPRYFLLLDTLRPASSDASFRRYFRLNTTHPDYPSLIVMDAPPEHENCLPFIHIAQKLQQVGLNVPCILEQRLSEGFLLLNDLGNTTYYQRLQSPITDEELQSLYRDVLSSLVTMQTADASDLPCYDKERLMSELSLFEQWYLEKHHHYTLSDKEKAELTMVFQHLVAHNDAQAKVFVHRDFHSPNLMLSENGAPNPAVIDFQDAVLGPISYDLASLVMDARTTWDEAQQLDWAIRYWEKAREAGLPVPNDFADFFKDYEFMSLQRNLRILGVFVRLALRDQKPQYLDHLPRVTAYVRQVIQRYIAFKPLLRLFDTLEGKTTRVGYTF